MFGRTTMILVCLILAGVISLGYAEEAKKINEATPLPEDVGQTIEGIVNELENIGKETTSNAGFSGMSGGGCVEVDIELPDSVTWENSYGPGIAQSYFELTNCGDEAVQILLSFTLTINISYLIDTTFDISPFPIWLGAGETFVHECLFPIPPFEGNISVCASAQSGDATDSDCSSLAISGFGTGGMPVDLYGILLPGTDCIVFAPAADPEHAYVLENYGDFGIGDTVHVIGNLLSNCDMACPEAVGCIVGNSIESAVDPGMPFENCGYLVASENCILFVPRLANAGPYNPDDTVWQMILSLENYGDFHPGDSVFVSGILLMETDPECPEAIGQVLNNIIEPCDEWPPIPYQACGIIVEGVECLLFTPIPNTEALFLLDNYGTFGIGDTVFVQGFLISDCETFCMQNNGCIVDNTIGPCGGPPPTYIEACGVLHETQTCMLFAPFDSAPDSVSVMFFLQNYGDFVSGDTVFVSGIATFDCELFAYCDTPIVGCIIDNIIDTCGGQPTVPFQGCGVLIEEFNCILFAPLGDYYTRILLENYGNYGPGDTVYVSGTFCPCYQPECGDTTVCLCDNTIGDCEDIPPDTLWFEGCGLLTPYDNCITFMPLDEMYIHYVLENYGTYGVGDTVFVAGMVDGYTDACSTIVLPFISDNIIDLCDSLPPDSVFYSGCGILLDDTGCIIFHPFDYGIPPAVLSDYGGFDFGDSVYVEGLMVPDCGDMCDYGMYVCLFNDIIESCGMPPDTVSYQGCGILLDDSGCIRFHAFDYGIPPVVLTDYGDFGMFDTVFVAGTVDFDCEHPCAYGDYICLNNDIIDTCGGSPEIPYEACGILAQVDDCLIFVPAYQDSILTFIPWFFILDNYGPFGDGDTVFVNGMLQLGCPTECPDVFGCVLDNTIEPCEIPPDTTYYGGCGFLFDDSGCTKFMPMGGVIPPLLLTDYGDFTIGDTVMVHGILDLIVGCECMGTMHPCLQNDSIGPCGGQPQDSIYFSGCGTLRDDSGCIFFDTPLDVIPPVLLTDYGGYTPGDSVFVEGVVFLDPMNGCECLGIMHPCLYNHIIELCGGQPPDTSFFSGCGVLIDDSGCVIFHPFDPAFPPAVLDNYGSFGIGDSVFVEGPSFPDCYNICDNEYYVCLVNNIIDACGGSPPPDSGFYSGCGVLVDDSGCVIFHPFDIAIRPAVLNEYGSFNVGDTVFVEGPYFADCYNICDNEIYVCMINNIIETCYQPDSFYYAGCGMLVDDTGCIFFYPEDNAFPKTLLVDYGEFSIGDIVYVEGLVMLDPMNGCECLGSSYPCLYNSIITECGGGDPGMPYEGCGVLMTMEDCLLFNPLENDTVFCFGAFCMTPFVLDNYEGFSEGDTVFVSGTLYYECSTACIAAIGCIVDNTIGLCDGNASSGVRKPVKYEIYNYPNPFNPVTDISIYLPEAVYVTLKVYNILGQEVETLIDNEYLQGQHNVEWDGSGRASGIYFYRMDAGEITVTRKMVLTR